MSSRTEPVDVVIGVAAVGAGAARQSLRIVVGGGRLAARMPVFGPIAGDVARNLAQTGARARTDGVREANAALDRSIAAVLRHPRTRELFDALLSSPELKQLLTEALDSDLVLDVVDHVLDGPAVQHAMDHIAASPELRDVIAQQSAGMAEQTIEGVRRRSANLDDATERVVRKWLRRPRTQAT